MSPQHRDGGVAHVVPAVRAVGVRGDELHLAVAVLVQRRRSRFHHFWWLPESDSFQPPR